MGGRFPFFHSGGGVGKYPGAGRDFPISMFFPCFQWWSLPRDSRGGSGFPFSFSVSGLPRDGRGGGGSFGGGGGSHFSYFHFF